MFGKTPKPLDAVYVILGLLVDHAFRVIDGVMLPQTFEGFQSPDAVAQATSVLHRTCCGNERNRYVSYRP